MLLAGALCTAAVAPVGSAFGTSTLDQKRAEARHIAQQIDANNTRIDVLDEQFLQTQLHIVQLNKGISTARKSLGRAQQHTDKLRQQVRSRAADLYMGARSGTLFPQLDAHNAQEVASRTSYTAAAAARDSALLSNLRTASAQLSSKRRTLEDARNKATVESTRLASTKVAIEHANDQARRLLTEVNGEIGQLVREQQAREAEARRRAAQAELERQAAEQRARQGGGLGFGGQKAPTNLPKPTGSAAVAIDAAKAELGKPYRYAAAGPDMFDCSGLTMYAWGKAGVSMVHSSAGQYTEFPHVPISQLAPGDLVFFGNPIHHVGLYVGNGTMIEAPHTGAFVRYASIYRDDYHGAVRP